MFFSGIIRILLFSVFIGNSQIAAIKDTDEVDDIEFKYLLEPPKALNTTYGNRLRNLQNPSPMSCDVDASHSKTSRNYQSRKWPNGNLYMQIDPSFSPSENLKINNALYDLHVLDCIAIGLWPPQYTPTGDYVFIRKGPTGSGCWSYVGKIGGQQILNLEPGCIYHDIIMHEAIHALGFEHEQCRPDRKYYVDISWDNIQPGKAHNFEVRDIPTFSIPYDYSSIMHYGSTAFSKNGQKTISAKNGTPVGPSSKLTAFDKAKLAAMYC